MARIELHPDVPICQTDLPLDWYQDEFRSYAEEYLALPDRKPQTVFPWLDRYVKPAQDHFGDELLLLAHFYMGGEIVKLVERYGAPHSIYRPAGSLLFVYRRHEEGGAGPAWYFRIQDGIVVEFWVEDEEVEDS